MKIDYTDAAPHKTAIFDQGSHFGIGRPWSSRQIVQKRQKLMPGLQGTESEFGNNQRVTEDQASNQPV